MPVVQIGHTLTNQEIGTMGDFARSQIQVFDPTRTAQAMRFVEDVHGDAHQPHAGTQGPILAARQLRSLGAIGGTVSLLAGLHCRQSTTSQFTAWRIRALVEGSVVISLRAERDDYFSRNRNSGFSTVTSVFGRMLFVIETLAPIVEPAPMTVSPPNTVALA